MSRGFTLVEMLVVLAILGITAAVTAPSLARSLESRTPATPADQLTSLLQQVRYAAVQLAKPRAFTLSPETGRYWMEGDTLVHGIITGVEVPDRRTARGRMILSRVRIVFRPDGTASGGPLFLALPTGRVRIDVDRWTGAIHVATP